LTSLSEKYYNNLKDLRGSATFASNISPSSHLKVIPVNAPDIMNYSRYKRLVNRGLTTERGLEEATGESLRSGKAVEELLIERGIPRHEILLSLSEYYGMPFVEYDEEVVISQSVTRGLDLERLKSALWIPVSVVDGSAEVIAYSPGSPATAEDVKKTLGVENIRFMVALTPDIVRIIENHQDINPEFSPAAGRTPLAKTRTFLTNRRTQLAFYRTELAKGRTGLAFLRTGISFIAIAVLLYRIFGPGYLSIAEAALLVVGFAAAVDGLLWYIPARKSGNIRLDCRSTVPARGSTVLEVSNPGVDPSFDRTAKVGSAAGLREDWDSMTPVMRRRFLASDRTDMAEERTTLACYRTAMAKARTGLAFTRTGIAFVGLGVAFIRSFHAGPWTSFDAALIVAGVLMAMEGMYWYILGRSAGMEGIASIKAAEGRDSIWDSVFPPAHKRPDPEDFGGTLLPIREGQSPGIWGTTGLALERTVLADRRGVMARLRTVMARSRTGMAFIRTGLSIFSVGLGLLVYFGAGNIAWTVADALMIAAGLAVIADGLYWHMPAEKTRRQFPYCFADMEITAPDYGRPVRQWKKAVFSHDDI